MICSDSYVFSWGINGAIRGMLNTENVHRTGKDCAMGKLLLGLGLALLIFTDYCCCRVASQADRQMEEWVAEQGSDGDATDEPQDGG